MPPTGALISSCMLRIHPSDAVAAAVVLIHSCMPEQTLEAFQIPVIRAPCFGLDLTRGS